MATLAARRILARDPLTVDDAELRREGIVRSNLQALAKACIAAPSDVRTAMARQLVGQMVAFYASEATRDVSAVEYRADAAGITVKDVGQSGGKLVIGDDALKRAGGGAIDQVGQELRGAAGQLATVEFSAHRPAIVWIGGERVQVASADEAKDAERIVTLLKDSYGVTFDSVATRREVRKDKAERGRADELRAYDVAPWTYLDLKDLELGFKYFAPVLGKERTKSARAKTPQEVVRLGRISSPTTAEAQYFQSSGTIATYESHPSVVTDPDPQTVTHEIAHAIFGPLVEDFKKSIGYWTATDRSAHEAPPTPYGAKDADEDLADSVSLYFTAPDQLKTGMRGKKRGEVGNPCPKRYRWIQQQVANWKPGRR
jgi:hypothetical protein